MGAFRLVVGLLLLICIGLFAAGVLKREPRWTRLGRMLLKWTLVAALGFFAVLLLQRLIE